MKTTLSILLAFALFSVAASAKDEAFPKIGSTYLLTFATTGPTSTIFKVISHGTAEWYLVEYEVILSPVQPATTPKREKVREWLNFNQVVSAESIQSTH
jgi:hypothetical protein